jgi:Holliday junction DNA helicase RuvA
MIVRLCGTLIEASPSSAVLDVSGVGFELGISATTAAELPAVGQRDVALFVRMVVREGAMDLYGFSRREERALFDRLVAISGVGPKLALSVLSTYTPAQLALIVAEQDSTRMMQVSGVGKRTAQRLLVELEDVFARDMDLRGLAASGLADKPIAAPSGSSSLQDEATAALLSMGFSPQEAELAVEGSDEAGVTTIEAVLGYALRRLGGGR